MPEKRREECHPNTRQEHISRAEGTGPHFPSAGLELTKAVVVGWLCPVHGRDGAEHFGSFQRVPVAWLLRGHPDDVVAGSCKGEKVFKPSSGSAPSQEFLEPPLLNRAETQQAVKHSTEDLSTKRTTKQKKNLKGSAQPGRIPALAAVLSYNNRGRMKSKLTGNENFEPCPFNKPEHTSRK